MRKIHLRETQMSDAAYIDQAAGWARELTHAESRGPGDIVNAWDRLARRHNIPARAFWALRYRRPKEMGVSLWFRFKQAHEAECERQLRKLRHEIETTKAITGPDDAVVAQIEALVAETDK